MFRMRMIGKILKQARLGWATVFYVVVFVGCALIISLVNQNVGGFGNALWLCYQTATTVGFGDVATSGIIERILLVVLSIVSLFYLAIITGVVVAYVTEMVKAQNTESLGRVVDDIEHLEDKTPEELRDISRRARELHLK